MEFLTLVWTSFVSVIAPVLGTIAGILLLLVIAKVLKWMGLQVDQKTMDAVSAAAGRAVKAVEVWAAKKQLDGGAKPESVEKAQKATAMVKTFLANNKLYDIADDKIAAAIEAKLGEDAPALSDLVSIIHAAKGTKKGK